MIQKKDNKKWLAAYLYYSEPWEALLVDAVYPFAKKILAEKLADQFFFIRYWERGPHIRLRFKGNARALNEIVKPALIDHFECYFKDHPTKREDPDWLKDVADQYQWFENNSVQFIPYEPEIKRYGGPVSMLLSEQQFQASSRAILEIIKESKDWDYTRALGAAIQLHLGFAYGLGMDLQEASDFYTRLYQNWLPRAYYFFEKDVSKDELDKRKKETLDAFELNFKQQKATLLPFFETVWEALTEGREFEQEWLNQWVNDMRAIGDQLKAIQNDGKLVPPEWYVMKNPTSIHQRKQQERWGIYDSYIHMTNNRLGILNRDEGFLGYLIKESLNAIGVAKRT